LQAKQLLNAYWTQPPFHFADHPAKCEAIWSDVAKFAKLDARLGEKGFELDEFEAHQFLEHDEKGGALTVKDMRDAMKKIDLNFDRMMSLTEYFVFHYDLVKWGYLVNWVASGSAAQRAMLQQVQDQMQTAKDALLFATDEAEKSNVEAFKAAAAAAQAQAAVEASEASAQEAAAANAALIKLQAEKAAAIAAEEVKSVDATLSTVKRNTAFAHLKILQSEDSQPLRTAQITQAAMQRKATKAAKAALAAAVTAEFARVAAVAAAAAADKAAEAALVQVGLLSDQLEEAKATCAGSGSDEGTFWWLDREFEENLKYMGPKQRTKAEAARTAARRRSGAKH